MHFDWRSKEDSETLDNDTDMSNFKSSPLSANLSSVRINLRDEAVQNQPGNLFSFNRQIAQTDLDVCDDLFEFPIKPLDESLLSSFDLVDYQSDDQIPQGPVLDERIQNLLDKFEPQKHDTMDKIINTLFPRDNLSGKQTKKQPTKKKRKVQPEVLVSDDEPLNFDIDTNNYFDNKLSTAVYLWLGQYSQSSNTFFGYRTRMSKFMTYLKNHGITTPREKDIVEYYNQFLLNKNDNRARSEIAPIISFFKWAQDNGIYFNIAKHLGFRTNEKDRDKKCKLTRLAKTDPYHEDRQINRFMNKQVRLKNTIDIVNQWTSSLDYINFICLDLGNHILSLIGHMKKNNTSYLTEDVVCDYLKVFLEKNPDYANASFEAIKKFIKWANNNRIDLTSLF